MAASMVGRSDLLDKMVSILLAGRTGDRGLLVMPIVGGPGVGKTRLANAILYNSRVRRKFHVRLRVPLAQQFKLRDIASELSAGGDYLIVLDDAWSNNEMKWVEIIKLVTVLPGNGRLVLTTRTPCVVTKIATIVQTDANKPFYLHPLDKEVSSAFVSRWIASCYSDCPTELITEAGMTIASKCGGVPLLLDHACRFFCQPQNMKFWQRFLENTDQDDLPPDILWRELLAFIDDLLPDMFWLRFLGNYPQQDELLERASVSYQRLAYDYRNCFSYCSMFPSDYDFNFEELVDLLAAAGHIPSKVDEGKRRDFLDKFLDECFYPLQEQEYGDKTIYRMHKVLHIFAQNKCRVTSSVFRADQASQLTTKFTGPGPSTIRRASLVVNPLSASFPRSLFACKNLGALILLQEGAMWPSEQPRCEITDIPQEFSRSFQNLHTLSFSATKIRTLPTKFLEHVKYLNLSQTDIMNIPSSISRLQNLQTLVLSHCYKLKKLHPNTVKLAQLEKLDLEGCCNLEYLPQEMSKMKSLVYLNVTECSSLTQLPRGVGQLKSLETLLGYIVSNVDGSSLSELQLLANLHRLSLQNLEKVSDPLDVRNARLEHKTMLKSLSLRWNIDGSGNTTKDYAVLESIQPHRYLKTLEIVAYEGKNLPSWIRTTKPYLKSLVEIKLINLRSCELPPLGQLPCLKIAEISGAETVFSINDNFYSHNGTFPSLEKLTFSYMHNLEVWEQAHRADMFPRLAELAIIQCPKLRALRMELPSVEKLILWMDNMVLNGLKGSLRGVARNLEHIAISFSERLVASSDCEGLQDLGKLTKLEIRGCDELTCLPQGLKHLSNIRSLRIHNCSKLETLPDWLEVLPSLEIIFLSCCPMLHYIPGGLEQRPGIVIYIENCPSLPEEPTPNSSAQSSGGPVTRRVDKGKEIITEDG